VLGLLGTRFTMQGRAYPDVFARRGMTIAALIALAGAGYLLWRVFRAFVSAGPKDSEDNP